MFIYIYAYVIVAQNMCMYNIGGILYVRILCRDAIVKVSFSSGTSRVDSEMCLKPHQTCTCESLNFGPKR